MVDFMDKYVTEGVVAAAKDIDLSELKFNGLAIADLIPEETQTKRIINNPCVKMTKDVYDVLKLPQEKG